MDETKPSDPGPESVPPPPGPIPSGPPLGEPPLFAPPATEPVPPPPQPASPAASEPPLYVPPPPPPIAWSPEPAPVAPSPGVVAEPPVRWDAPQDRGGVAVPGAPDLIYAGTLARFVAYVLDSLILGVVSIILAVVMVAALGGGDLATAAATTTFLALDLVYFVLLWTGRRRATFGMRLLKLQIGNAVDGRTLTGEQAVRRWVAYGQWLYLLAIAPALASLGNGLAFLWAVVLLVSVAMDGIHQGVHDKFAGTAIVQPRGTSNGLLVGCIVIIGVIALIGFVGIVALIFLGSQISGIETTP